MTTKLVSERERDGAIERVYEGGVRIPIDDRHLTTRNAPDERGPAQKPLKGPSYTGMEHSAILPDKKK